jgi:hypothetical protein
MKLDTYFLGLLQQWSITVPEFCVAKKLHYASVIKYIRGKTPRLHEAKKIVKATDGKVTLKDLGVTDD